MAIKNPDSLLNFWVVRTPTVNTKRHKYYTMAQENSPAFQFYPKDWLVLTEGFSSESFGLIWKTICFIWLSENQESIENDDETISFSLGCDLDKWKSVKKMAVKKGIFKIDDANFLTSPPLLKLLENQAAYKEKQRLNGLKGGRPRNLEEPKPFFGKPKITSPSPSPSPTTILDIDKSISLSSSVEHGPKKPTSKTKHNYDEEFEAW